MKKLLVIPALVGGLLLAAPQAQAHYDSVDGPVAAAAMEALASGDVKLVPPYLPETAEAAIGDAFARSLSVRAGGGEAGAPGDRYFVETAVRLRRAGEGAPYTGLKPAGMDFGPAIPAAERAIERGDPDEVLALLATALEQGIEARFSHVLRTRDAPRAPRTEAEVASARQSVDAEFGFIAYVEALRQAAEGAPGSEHREWRPGTAGADRGAGRLARIPSRRRGAPAAGPPAPTEQNPRRDAITALASSLH